MGRYTVYTDACTKFKFIKDPHTREVIYGVVSRASIGIVIRDPEGNRQDISYPVTPKGTTYVEYLAVRIACEHLISIGVKKADFYTDCINMALMCNQGIMGEVPNIRDLAYEIRSWLDKFEDYTVTWVPRRENREANDLAIRSSRVPEIIKGN